MAGLPSAHGRGEIFFRIKPSHLALAARAARVVDVVPSSVLPLGLLIADLAEAAQVRERGAAPRLAMP
jgi:hypothetical protein